MDEINDQDLENKFAEMSKNKFAQEILDLKDSKMSWIDFYDVVLKFKNNPSITAEDFEKGDLLKIKLYWNATKTLSPSMFFHGASVEILQFGRSIGLLLTDRFANAAASKNQLDSLEYLKQLKIYPTKHGLNAAIALGNLDVLKFCVSVGLKPDSTNFYEAMKGNHKNVMNYLMNEFNMFPTQEDLSRGLKEVNYNVIDNCIKLGLKPTYEDIYNLLKKQKNPDPQ